ncbi:SRPBCC family protein [Nocardia takedensis]|uniref:SRPBCC family protein n=1 Tax=Nocardia takedensis TaxID=259390 RepID=UPI0003140C99|nr:SRPBCC family protein [Nocardia takedensis]
MNPLPNNDKAGIFHVFREIEISADPDTVFSCVSDLTRSGEWSPECAGGEWVSGGPEVVGSVFRGHNNRAPDVVGWAPVVRGAWTTYAEVVFSERPSVFGWAMRDSAGRAQQSVWSFQLAPTASGGTRLVHCFEMGSLTEGMRGILAQIPEPDRPRFIAEWSDKIERDMSVTLAAIRATIESAAVAGGTKR